MDEDYFYVSQKSKVLEKETLNPVNTGRWVEEILDSSSLKRE